ncbi:MAG: hypothetical protein QOI63_1986 [Thermoplasmata archaeon]|jgi:hypothetical protein|nr:hypothetical protein [Thermoplasmata archaeon]
MHAKTLLAGLLLVAAAPAAAAGLTDSVGTPDPVELDSILGDCLHATVTPTGVEYYCGSLQPVLDLVFRAVQVPFPHDPSNAMNACANLPGIKVSAEVCTSKHGVGLCFYFEGDQFGAGVHQVSGGVVLFFPFVGPGDDGNVSDGTQYVGYSSDC